MSFHVPPPLYHKEKEFRSGARSAKNSCMMNNSSMPYIQKDRSHSVGGGARRGMIVFTIHAVSYTPPHILMDSIRSPDKVLILLMDSR